MQLEDTTHIIKICFLNFHPVCEQGIRMLMRSEPDMEVVSEDALPDVVLLSLSAFATDAVVAEAIGAHPGARVLLVSAQRSPERALQLMNMGAAGYVTAQQDWPSILAAIRAVARGECVPPLPRQVRARQDVKGATSLSTREREVMDLILSGHTNEKIASRLHISRKTVETHRANMNRKLGLHSVVDLFLTAGARGVPAR